MGYSRKYNQDNPASLFASVPGKTGGDKMKEKKEEPAKKEGKPAPVVQIEKRTASIFVRVKPSTREFFASQVEASGCYNLGQFLDELAEQMQK